MAMKTKQICPVCNKEFTRIWAQKKHSPIHCSRACANKSPGRMTDEIKARMGMHGSNNPNWGKGQWLQRGSKGDAYMRVWIPPEQRHLYPTCRKGYVSRSHIVWNQAHPNDIVKAGEIVHHIDGDSLNDIPENLQKFASQSPHAQNHSRELVKIRPRNDKGQFI